MLHSFAESGPYPSQVKARSEGELDSGLKTRPGQMGTGTPRAPRPDPPAEKIRRPDIFGHRASTPRVARERPERPERPESDQNDQNDQSSKNADQNGREPTKLIREGQGGFLGRAPMGLCVSHDRFA